MHGNKQSGVSSISLGGIDDCAVVEQPMQHRNVPFFGGQHERGLAIGSLEIAEARRVRVLVQKGGQGGDIAGMGVKVKWVPRVGKRVVVDRLHGTR